MTLYYDIVFVISFILTTTYLFRWNKRFNVNITIVFILVPIGILGQAMFAYARDLQSALFATHIVYIGGCYLGYFVMQSVFDLCEINMSRVLRTILFVYNSAVYVLSLTMGVSDIFYKSVSLEIENGIPLLVKTYGPAHTLFYLNAGGYFVVAIVTIIYSHVKKHQVSNYILNLLVLPELICVIGFFGGRKVFPGIELLPACYVVSQFVYLLIVSRLRLYDLTDNVADTMLNDGATGVISFDERLRYLGSNAAAKECFPHLEEQNVDRKLCNCKDLEPIMKWVEAFAKDEKEKNYVYAPDDKGEAIYKIEVEYLYDFKKRCGYQVLISDDTKNQKYISLINSYNEDLKKEVEEKTRHIVEMHDNLILSMATMVESRDNSTGGHIKRTSEGVRMLIEEMKKDENCKISEEFSRDIIKAAPMHDLGKIAVDDAVLRKPGRFTDEEYAIMKTHAAEGARIVHEILKGTDDESFKTVAENVAHFHHEKWDGTGYPEGLKGEEIPLEARIMAIADVYDALVSKRVYKERMSFEKADSIIMEGMGKHFDPGLERFYVAARPHLEKYYSGIDA